MEKLVSVAPLYRGALEHSGISGMKWGKRRYRNYDGTLTEEGKERYYPKTYMDREVRFKSAEAAAEKTKERWFTPNIKTGKDKPPITRAEAVGKELVKTSDAASDIAQLIEKAKNSKKGRPSKKLSNEELQKRINRLQLERQYDSLSSADVAAGKVTTEDIIRGVQGFLTMAVAGATIYALAKK